MKHLLNSIESRALDLSHTDLDVTQLLTNVRDTRDLKSVEGLTDAMEKVLQELRGTEHAVPFLKPVKRSEAPNYDLIIKEPMDLFTMGRKVRQHLYKTKRDFISDLNLIWENCLTYNTEPTHPLRRSTVFMRKKADQAVEKYLGGPDSRSTPIPQLNINGLSHNHHGVAHVNGRDLSGVNDGINPRIRIKFSTPKTPASRGKADGHSLATGEDRCDSSLNKYGASKELTSPTHKFKSHHRPTGTTRAAQSSFADSPAIIRTPQTMKQYYDLDYAMQPHLDSEGAGPSKPSGFQLPQRAQATLMSTNPMGNGGSGYLSIPMNGGTGTLPELQSQLESAVQGSESRHASLSRAYQDCLTAGTTRGPKRSTQADNETISNHPRKRLKTSLTPEQARIQEGLIQDGRLLGAWWGAMASGDLIGNGAPPLASESSQSPNRWQVLLGKSHVPRSKPTGKLKLSHSKEVPGLKGIIYKNIDSLRRIRRTHTALLSTVGASNQGNDEDVPRRNLQAARRPDPLPLSRFAPSIGNMNGRIKNRVPVPIPIEGGSKLANTILRGNCAQLLEHSGFESSSSRALDMIAHVASEFLMNMGRTLRFLGEQRPLNMTPQEIVLHTLSESGIPEVRRLDAYIHDDVERYGSRLTDLERKLHNAWEDELDANAEGNEFDDGLVDDDDALIAGDFLFAADRDQDFFGLRALGLEKELGLPSLTVPSRLFHGRAKKDANGNGSGPGGSKEPTLPFPPPQPFIPLNSHKIDSQIGLLHGYYRGKFDKHRESTLPSPPPPTAVTVPVLYPDGSAPPPSAAPPVPSEPFNYDAAPPFTIADDQPSALRVKMGPNGQVTVPTSSATASSRKKKAAASAGAGDTGGASAGGTSSAPKAKGGGLTGAKTPAKKKTPKTSPKKPTTNTNNALPQQPPAVLAS